MTAQISYAMEEAKYMAISVSGLSSISEFSNYVGISKASLRHYDEIGLLKPTKRGLTNSNKNRYYSNNQLADGRMIRIFTEIGITLNKIEEVMRNRSPEAVLKLLNKQSKKISSRIKLLYESLNIINEYNELLIESIRATESDIDVIELPEKRIILDEANIPDDINDLFTAFSRFCESPHDPAVNAAMPIGRYFNSMDNFQKKQLNPNRLFAIDPNGNEKWTSGLYMIGYARGPYGIPNDLPGRMITYAKDNGLSFTGPVYNIYLLNEISVADPSQYLLKAFVSVKETQKKYNRMLFPESEKESNKKPIHDKCHG